MCGTPPGTSIYALWHSPPHTFALAAMMNFAYIPVPSLADSCLSLFIVSHVLPFLYRPCKVVCTFCALKQAPAW